MYILFIQHSLNSNFWSCSCEQWKVLVYALCVDTHSTSAFTIIIITATISAFCYFGSRSNSSSSINIRFVIIIIFSTIIIICGKTLRKCDALSADRAANCIGSFNIFAILITVILIIITYSAHCKSMRYTFFTGHTSFTICRITFAKV